MRSRALLASFVVLLLLVTATSVPAAAPSHDPHAAGASTTPAASAPRDQPALAAGHVRWPGAIVIIVAGLFLAAAIIGPVVRANLPEEPPPPHHDEHHGSHDHARGGPTAHGH